MNIKDRFKRLGMKAFINIYPELKKNENISEEELTLAFPQFKNFTHNARQVRLSNARAIFREGKVCEALRIIIESKRVSEEIRNKAKYYLLQEQNIVDINQVLDEKEHPDIEGLRKSVFVNIYERSTEARRKAIEYHGVKCCVCGFDFEKVYGELGKGFIHIHHITPISEIGKTYEVNPITDLIPVCPNCHAMLHKGKNGKTLTVEDLKFLINKG